MDPSVYPLKNVQTWRKCIQKGTLVASCGNHGQYESLSNGHSWCPPSWGTRFSIKAPLATTICQRRHWWPLCSWIRWRFFIIGSTRLRLHRIVVEATWRCGPATSRLRHHWKQSTFCGILARAICLRIWTNQKMVTNIFLWALWTWYLSWPWGWFWSQLKGHLLACRIDWKRTRAINWWACTTRIWAKACSTTTRMSQVAVWACHCIVGGRHSIRFAHPTTTIMLNWCWTWI